MNSVHRQWLRPTFHAVCDPRTPPVLPTTSPVQVTDVVTDGVSLPAGARLLLSDKQLKVWSLVSATALARFQDQFPEFKPTARNLCKLAGGIIVPTRWSMLVHPHLREFVMQIDEFEYKGGAGNNEFAHPIFHTDDAEVQQLLHQYRNIDVTPVIDRALFDAAPAAAAAVSSSGTTGSAALPSLRMPFIASVRAEIDALVRDPRNASLEAEAVISAEQAQQLAAIDDGFSRSVARKEAEEDRGAAVEGEGAAPPHEPESFSCSQLDSFQESQGYFSQELDASATHDDFSQLAPAAVTSAAAVPAAAAASLGAAAPVQFTTTQLFLKKQMRSEGESARPAAAAAASAAAAPLSSNQAFVAAFGGVSTSFTVTAPLATAAASSHDTAGKNAAAAAASAANGKPAESRSPSKASLSFPQSQSPGRGSARPSLSPSRSPGRHSLSVPISPARSSLSVADADAEAGGGVGAHTQAPCPPSQESLHNLPIDSLDEPVRVYTPQPDGASQPGRDGEEVEGDEAELVAAQESEFPFLTQAPLGNSQEPDDDDDEEEGPAPMDMDSSQQQSEASAAAVAASTPAAAAAAAKRALAGSAAHTPSPLSLRIPPTPSAGSSAVSSTTPSAKTSPYPAPFVAPAAAAAAAVATSYTASSIQQRQAARERKVQEQMEAVERQRVAEQQRLQRIKDEEVAAAAAAAAAQAKLQADLAAAAAEADAERQRAEAAEAEVRRLQAEAAAAAAAASGQRARPADADADAMSDEEAYALAANLAAPSTKKRGRQEHEPQLDNRHASSAAAASAPIGGAAAAAAPASKKPRMTGIPARREASPVPTFIEDGVRRAMQAMEAAENKGRSTKQSRPLRFPQLPLSIVPSRSRQRDASIASVAATPSSVAASTPATVAAPSTASAASAAASSSVDAAAAVPVASAAAARAVSPSAPLLPPFGLRFPISAAEVQAAVRYFRTRQSSSQPNGAAASAPKSPAASRAVASPGSAAGAPRIRGAHITSHREVLDVDDSDGDDEPSAAEPHAMDDDDVQYSQCF